MHENMVTKGALNQENLKLQFKELEFHFLTDM
jgi:hypothetical protein